MVSIFSPFYRLAFIQPHNSLTGGDSVMQILGLHLETVLII